MAETKKSTRARKPARTIEQQIADLQAKAEAKQDRQRQIANKKYEAAVESAKSAKARYVNALHAVDEQRLVLEELGVEIGAEESTMFDWPQTELPPAEEPVES